MKKLQSSLWTIYNFSYVWKIREAVKLKKGKIIPDLFHRKYNLVSSKVLTFRESLIVVLKAKSREKRHEKISAN